MSSSSEQEDLSLQESGNDLEESFFSDAFDSKVSEFEDSGNQSIDQYLSVHKDSFGNQPTKRSLEKAVVVDWPKMMKFKAT
ncbi:hypothetical protein AVEN_81127-1 [Araneus ventricosus]|uniref:Uncharacterized protein n=1 Tax=Araneus ventricosus TaxID=182803 RepID=A0A4Y2N348_ARAVE|nr:hypothetical protein AVEN_81127-1 [Araneus ventricosus]